MNWRIVKAKVLQNYLLKMKNGCPMSSFANKNALVHNVLMGVLLRVLHWFIFKIHSYIYVLTKSSNIYFGYASHVLWVAYNIFWINDVQAWLHSSDPCWVCWCGSAQHYGLISIKRCNSNWKNSTFPFFWAQLKKFQAGYIFSIRWHCTTAHYSTFVLKKSIFSAVVLKHTISKRNKLLSWHKNLTRITSLITNVRNFDRNMISQSFYFLHFSFI